MRTPSSPARARRISHGYWRFRRGAPGVRPGMTQGLPGDAGKVREHLRGGRGEGDEPRPGLGVREAELAGGEVDVLPAKPEDLAPAAAGENEEADGRDRGRGGAARARRRHFEDAPEPAELVLGEEALVPALPELLDRAARVGHAGRAEPVVDGHVQDPGEEVNGAVGGVGGLAEAVVELRDLLAADGRDRGVAEGGHEVAADGGPVERPGPRLAEHRDVLLKVPLGELRHRDGHRRGCRRLLPCLDPGDDPGRPPPRLPGRDCPVPPERDPPGPPLAPALDDVDLGARRIHPNPEAGEVPVPEDRVPALDGEAVDDPLGEPPAAGYGHGSHLVPLVPLEPIVPRAAGIGPAMNCTNVSMP